MSEKRLIDWDGWKKRCLYLSLSGKCYHGVGRGARCTPKHCANWKALPSPTLPDVCGTRKLDSMTEEEFLEYRTQFTARNRQADPKEDIIESIKLHIHWDEVPLLAVKWLLDHGFNMWEGK